MSAKMPRMLRNTRLLYVAGALLLLLAMAPAFTAANTTPATSAGADTSTVSGYTLGAPVITLNVADPTMIDEIAFAATAGSGAATPTTVLVRFDSTVPEHLTINECLVSGSTPNFTITCDTTDINGIAVGTDALTVLGMDIFNTIIAD